MLFCKDHSSNGGPRQESPRGEVIPKGPLLRVSQEAHGMGASPTRSSGGALAVSMQEIHPEKQGLIAKKL